MRGDSSFRLILLCFFLSGFAGLVFETLWTREFALVFGTSELAVATVLAAYMGGLAAGAALTRRWVLRTARPVPVYAFLELGIGLGALAVPWGIAVARSLAGALFGGQPVPPGQLRRRTHPLHPRLLRGDPAGAHGLHGSHAPTPGSLRQRREEEIGTRVALL